MTKPQKSQAEIFIDELQKNPEQVINQVKEHIDEQFEAERKKRIYKLIDEINDREIDESDKVAVICEAVRTIKSEYGLTDDIDGLKKLAELRAHHLYDNCEFEQMRDHLIAIGCEVVEKYREKPKG